MADFKKQGGSLTGREERYDGFEGEPRAVGGALGGSSTGHTGHHSSTTTGPHSSNLENKMDPRVDSDRDGSRNLGATGAGTGGYGTGSSGTTGGYAHSTGTGYGSTSTKKPGLMDKLNPMKGKHCIAFPYHQCFLRLMLISAQIPITTAREVLMIRRVQTLNDFSVGNGIMTETAVVFDFDIRQSPWTCVH